VLVKVETGSAEKKASPRFAGDLPKSAGLVEFRDAPLLAPINFILTIIGCGGMHAMYIDMRV
jgi:hypothetical protein